MYPAWIAVAFLNLIFVGLHGFVDGSGHSPNGIPDGERPQMDKDSKRLSTVKKRSQRVTPIQKEIYLSHLENEKEMRHKKPSDASIQALWTKMCSKLNAVKGPMKEIEEWKKVFDNWRYVTMKKKRTIVADIQKTGGGPATTEALSALEERAISCWGKIVVEGLSDLPTAGFGGVAATSQDLEDINLQVLDDECIVVGGGDLEEPEIDDATAITVESTPKSSATRSHKRKTTEIADVEDDIRCFCNLPQCVSTNYMCRPSKIVGSKQNGCFSEVREPTDKSPTRHGCVDLLDNLDQPMKCDNSPRDHSGSSGAKASSGHAYTEMLLLCCYEDLCNHDDNLESQKIKSDLAESTDILSPGRFATYDETDLRLNVPMLPSPGLSNNDDWFRVATIAVPICGAVILFSLIAVAIKILRSERIALTSSKLDSPSVSSRKFPIDHEAQIMKTSPHLSRYTTNNYLSDCDKKNESRAKLNQLINLEYSLLPQSCNDNIKPNNTEPCGSNNFNRNVNITLETTNINTKESLDKVYEKETLNSKSSNWSGSNTYKSYDI